MKSSPRFRPWREIWTEPRISSAKAESRSPLRVMPKRDDEEEQTLLLPKVTTTTMLVVVAFVRATSNQFWPCHNTFSNEGGTNNAPRISFVEKDDATLRPVLHKQYVLLRPTYLARARNSYFAVHLLVRACAIIRSYQNLKLLKRLPYKTTSTESTLKFCHVPH